MTRLRMAVIGAGHLGRIHARLLQDLPQAHLIAVVDPDARARADVAREWGIADFADLREVIPHIDAAIVAAPTSCHHELGAQLLSRGVHVLMEKPLATTSAACQELVHLARKHACVLQVGHVERFNPALQAVRPLIEQPKYIEARRTSGYTFRSTDVGVVMDLMIHDLDIILQLVDSEVQSVQALGACVLSQNEDMAQARIQFANGCVANLTASRTSLQAERAMSIFCPTVFAGIDFAQRTVQVIQPRPDLLARSFRPDQLSAEQQAFVRQHLFETVLQREPLTVRSSNPIAEEQVDFVAAIQAQASPQVTGEDGSAAVQLAEMICQSIEEHAWNGTPSGPRGPHFETAPTILKAPLPQPEPTPSRRKAG